MKLSIFAALLCLIWCVMGPTAESKDNRSSTPRLSTEENKKMCAEGAQAQVEISICTGIEFEKWDDELNRIYQQIQMKHQQNNIFLLKLKKAQLAWISFRDAELEALYPLPDKGMEYGSSFGMCLYTWKTILTKERIRQLKKWIDGHTDDIGEGDVCTGPLLPR